MPLQVLEPEPRKLGYFFAHNGGESGGQAKAKDKK